MISKRQLEKLAKQIGMQINEIEAEEVIIKTAEKEIVVKNPQVSKMRVGGQEMFQISGEIIERPKEFSEDDIQLIIEQTGASREDVIKVLRETHGDLAQSIMKLKKK